MIEYSIFIINSGGKLFNLQPYFSIEDAKIALYNMLDLEIERNRIFYVDNDFYNNKFPPGIQNSKYFCIKEREVTEWKKSVTRKNNKDNIIYFRKSCWQK